MGQFLKLSSPDLSHFEAGWVNEKRDLLRISFSHLQFCIFCIFFSHSFHFKECFKGICCGEKHAKIISKFTI